ncbi:DNA repair protein RadC [Porphyromonas sp.]|uniref:RadC family protein n=1 Tax=Porphyromonas sp. TaxID=1924944 RepID=UPI0026DC65B2|nr:DNA repair protein RadC [Porphyromonas sp.]MDO4771854.1 DNA repair protein RadC [Porphyromonas sp.]
MKEATERGSLRMREMSEHDRPQEKLIKYGPKALSDTELVALILRTGTKTMNVLEMSQQLLRQHRDSLYALYQSLSAQMDSEVKGIGTTKTVMLMAALEMGVRLGREMRLNGSERIQVDRSQRVYDYVYSHFFGLASEELWVLTVNAGGFITSTKCISKGGVAETVADPKLILRYAVQRAAPAIILVHNHPGGTLKPSHEDDLLTERIAKACDLIDIKLLDHIIFTDTGYYSYCDNGRMP